MEQLDGAVHMSLMHTRESIVRLKTNLMQNLILYLINLFNPILLLLILFF